MLALRGLVRGYRRVVAQLVPPLACPICLDPVPIMSLKDAPRDGDGTFAKLRCKHKFCADCMRQYITMKMQAREVDEDQLVCPVVECRVPIDERDVVLVSGRDTAAQVKAMLKRKRDEKNPSARWCPRPGCGELIICETMDNFMCPKCQAVGCFRCRGFAHRFWFCSGEQDTSYLAWEKSVGNARAVRACPKCNMRIWKNEGCNHMTCTHCRHQYCWVCGTGWDPSHYACYELSFLSGASAWARRLQQAVGYAFIVLIVTLISVFGFYVFVGVYITVCAAIQAARAMRRIR